MSVAAVVSNPQTPPSTPRPIAVVNLGRRRVYAPQTPNGGYGASPPTRSDMPPAPVLVADSDDDDHDDNEGDRVVGNDDTFDLRVDSDTDEGNGDSDAGDSESDSPAS